MILFLGSIKQSYLGGDLGRDPGEELCSLPQLSLAGTPPSLTPDCVLGAGVETETGKHSVQPKRAWYSSCQVGIHILPASFFLSPILGPSLAHSNYPLNIRPKLT